MGIFSIILGIIVIISFPSCGAIIAKIIIDSKDSLSNNIVALNSLSKTHIMSTIFLVFLFIGLLIGMNLIMHGLTFRQKGSHNSSLGYICFALGIITLCLSIWAGLMLSNSFLQIKDILAYIPIFSFLRTTSSITIYGIITGFFAFIGLLLCINLIMHDLNYKKVGNLQRQLKKI